MKYLLFASVFLCSLASVAQSGYVQKLYAFTEKNSSANSYLVYIELSPDQTPIWDSALIDGSIYTVHHSPVETIPLQVGEQKKDGRMVVIKPKPGNKLYRLEFDLVEERNTAGELSSTEQVLLKGSFKNRRITSKINNAVELVPSVSG